MTTLLLSPEGVTMTHKQTPMHRLRNYAARVGASFIDSGFAKWEIYVPYFGGLPLTPEQELEHLTIIAKVRARAALLGMNVNNNIVSYCSF